MPRPSPVGDTVRALLESRARHSWSLPELHEAARSALGTADYSSVFRAVASMEREGLLTRVEVGDGRSRYELRDGHHEHVLCSSCGKVAEVPGCSVDAAAAAVERSTGFTVTSHRLVFTGVCPDCAPC